MKIKWLGHACFLITAEDGTRIITDPYESGGNIKYDKIAEAADIVVISHQHYDHNDARAVKGKPVIVTESQKAKGIEFKGVESFHDTSGGRQRGPNTIFCFTVDKIKVCHLGDLGHDLSAEQVSDIGEVDILLIPTEAGPPSTQRELPRSATGSSLGWSSPCIIRPVNAHSRRQRWTISSRTSLRSIESMPSRSNSKKASSPRLPRFWC